MVNNLPSNLPFVLLLCHFWGSEYSKDLSSFSHTVHRVLSALSSADPARVNCLSKQVAGRGDWEKESKTWKMSPSGMCLKRFGGDWFVLDNRLDMKVLTLDRSKIVVRCSTNKEMDSEGRWYMTYLIYMIPKAWEKQSLETWNLMGLGHGSNTLTDYVLSLINESLQQLIENTFCPRGKWPFRMTETIYLSTIF